MLISAWATDKPCLSRDQCQSLLPHSYVIIRDGECRHSIILHHTIAPHQSRQYTVASDCGDVISECDEFSECVEDVEKNHNNVCGCVVRYVYWRALQ